LSLTAAQKEEIKKFLINKVEKKLSSYSRETSALPFLTRLIQDAEKIAAYSFIHSFATSLGMSIYEEMSIIVSKNNSDEHFRNYGVGGVISNDQRKTISKIVNELREGKRVSNIKEETKEVLNASTKGAKYQKSGNIADFYMRKGKTKYFFEIKTVKPNIDVFEKSKTKLLEWIARRQSKIKVFLVFPYNPYHPKPYRRFTAQGIMNPPNDLLIGQEYWNFLGGKGTFNTLLKIFEEVGLMYKKRLKDKFQEIAKTKYENY
jgi:hypothetical protein